MGTKWFSDVTPYYEEKPPKSGKYILIFRVREMPVLKVVEFRGRKAVSQKEIEENTDLKVGNRADPTKTRLALGQIQRLYQEKGYELAEVKLVEGGNIGDTKVDLPDLRGPQVQDRHASTSRATSSPPTPSSGPRSAAASRSSGWSAASTTATCSRKTPASSASITRRRASSRSRSRR